jgi:hypothetical protein
METISKHRPRDSLLLHDVLRQAVAWSTFFIVYKRSRQIFLSSVLFVRRMSFLSKFKLSYSRGSVLAFPLGFHGYIMHVGTVCFNPVNPHPVPIQPASFFAVRGGERVPLYLSSTGRNCFSFSLPTVSKSDMKAATPFNHLPSSPFVEVEVDVEVDVFPCVCLPPGKVVFLCHLFPSLP